MKRIACLAAVVAAFVVTPALYATAPHAMLPPALAKAVAAFDQAQIHGDGAALQRLLADDYVLFNSQGKVENKQDFIRDYTTPGFTMKPFTVEQEVVRQWPGGAVMGGVATLEGTSDGKPYRVRLRFADIWGLRDGRWQVIHTSAMHVP
jgi:ketosteroid isomerase-like protein